MSTMDQRFDIFEESPEDLTGSMNIPSQGPRVKKLGASDFNTLDESIKDTFLRDFQGVVDKFKFVLFPQQKNNFLKDWDLWGPLILTTFMAIILQSDTDDIGNDGGPEFAEVFVIVWFGAFLVTLNSKLLGGNISFFQSVCVLGYCLLPLSISLIICKFILILSASNIGFVFRFLVTSFGFAWAIYAAIKFMEPSQPPNRKALAVYPMFLFYFILSWLVISHSN